MLRRPRRLRINSATRNLVRETKLNQIQKALYLLSLKPNLIYINSFVAMRGFSCLPRPNPL